VQTTENIAHALDIDYLSLKTLDELKAGVCDGLTYFEVSQKFPMDFKVFTMYPELGTINE